MRLKAYSKINLCLKIFPKIKDEKLHKIDSVFLLWKKCYDEIFIKKSKKLSIQYKINKKIICIDDCIVKKTLNFLQKKYGIDINYSIVIKKNIPIGSGLGGGSADAAATINYLTLHHNKNIVLDMSEICFKLGSDIPFFIYGYNIARVRNYGDYVSRIYDWKPKVNVFFNDIKLLSKDIYLALDNDQNFVSKVNVDDFINKFIFHIKSNNNIIHNDLTKYIIMSSKELRTIHNKYPKNYFFSGSGSSIVKINE